MPDNDINVTNASGDQDHSQSVHRHIASGMVADLVSDCERRRRQHEMGQDSGTAFGEHEIVRTANMKQMTVTKSYAVFILAVQLSRGP
jgi:hypothetical protein